MTSNVRSSASISLSAFRKLILGASVLWTGAVVFSFWTGVQNEKRQAHNLAVHEARANVQTDIGFRHWATSHGGVYVPPDERTPPNPYLNVPDRDVVTTSGQHLTLMNPAYMLRQLMQSGFVAKGRITSMKPLNPDNAPDEWEVKALSRLGQGETEVAEDVQEDGKSALRLMLPMRIDEGCLKCHGHQGYQVGDLRGGIDVTVALAPFEQGAAQEIRRLEINHGLIWLLVTCGIALTWMGGKAHIRRQDEAEAKIAHLTDVYAALSHTNQCIIRCNTRQELFESIVKIAVDFGHFKMAWIGIVDESTMEISPVAWAGDGFGYLDGLKISADPESPYGQGPSGRCIRSGEYCVTEDFAASNMTTPWHQRAASFGFQASAAFPLSNQKKTVGTLTLYSNETDFFTPELIELLLEMAGDISFALDRMDLEASHQRQEAERQEMVDRLTASNTELERFAYVASHDLQEPLRSIVSFTQLVERQLGDKLLPEEKTNFQFVVNSAKRMNLLIKDLLEFSRVTVKGNSFSNISLGDTCSAALENLKETIQESGAEIVVGDLPEVMGDSVQIMQVFQNLIGNAIKFRHANRPSLITIDSEKQDGNWRISVSDNGIGIADTTQDIFEIFRRLHSGNQYPGSGVGLAICKRIVTRHGGRIWVESGIGSGATFRFTLPTVLD
ncbi:ATP-binding protein [Paramagnetospirillum magneticum]|uniref:ATP-binding protein n=1 Tax=Paramagnetospirillum magneticum TaxID=84159 RepID=UPI0002E87CB4|nr:ATP-binding protein [Paramagnetospirillum magneticum]